jgi:hypothetical protein
LIKIAFGASRVAGERGGTYTITPSAAGNWHAAGLADSVARSYSAGSVSS